MARKYINAPDGVVVRTRGQVPPVVEFKNYVGEGFLRGFAPPYETYVVPATLDGELDYLPMAQGEINIVDQTASNAVLTVVPWGTTPASGQIAINYITGQFLVHSSAEGHTLLLQYRAAGSVMTAGIMYQLQQEVRRAFQELYATGIDQVLAAGSTATFRPRWAGGNTSQASQTCQGSATSGNVLVSDWHSINTTDPEDVGLVTLRHSLPLGAVGSDNAYTITWRAQGGTVAFLSDIPAIPNPVLEYLGEGVVAGSSGPWNVGTLDVAGGAVPAGRGARFVWMCDDGTVRESSASHATELAVELNGTVIYSDASYIGISSRVHCELEVFAVSATLVAWRLRISFMDAGAAASLGLIENQGTQAVTVASPWNAKLEFVDGSLGPRRDAAYVVKI